MIKTPNLKEKLFESFEAVQNAAGILKNKGIENPVWEAGLLMSYVLKKDISYVYTHHNCSLSPKIMKSIRI